MATFKYLVSSNTQTVQNFINQRNFVFIVNGDVENIEKNVNVFVFNYRCKSGGKSSVKELLNIEKNYKLFSEIKNLINNFETFYNGDAKIGIITSKLNANAIAIASIIEYEIDTSNVLNFEHRWLLEAISQYCDDDVVDSSKPWLMKYEETAIAFNQVLKEDINHLIEENGFLSDGFHKGVMRMLPYLKNGESLLSPKEWERCRKYIREQKKLRDTK